MQALQQRFIEKGRGVQSALALQVGEKTSVVAGNPGCDFVLRIGSVKGHLRKGVMYSVHSDDVILSCE